MLSQLHIYTTNQLQDPINSNPNSYSSPWERTNGDLNDQY